MTTPAPVVRAPARDGLGRVLDVAEDASAEEIAEAVARRDRLDAAARPVRVHDPVSGSRILGWPS